MKKPRLLALAFVALTISCRQHDKAKSMVKLPAAMTAPVKKIINPVTDDFPVFNADLKAYKVFLKGLNLDDAHNAVIAVNKFNELFKNDDAKVKDTAFVLFNRFDFDLTMHADDLHDKDSTIQYDSLLTDSNGKHSTQITAKTARYDAFLKTNGFRVTSEEGSTYIVQDLDFEVRSFKASLSAPLQQYLEQTTKEDKEGLAEDMGLVVAPRKVAERAVWWETFLKNNPAVIVSVQAKFNWDGDLEILLTGLDNSPVLNHRPYALNDDYAEAFNFLQKTYPNSKTNNIINPFYKLAAKRDSAGAAKLVESYIKQGVISKPEDEGD